MSDAMKHMTQNSSWGTHLQLIILRRRVMNLSDLTGAEGDKSSAAEMERIQKNIWIQGGSSHKIAI